MHLMKNKESKSCLRLISLRKSWMNFETLNIEKPHLLRKIRIYNSHKHQNTNVTTLSVSTLKNSFKNLLLIS